MLESVRVTTREQAPTADRRVPNPVLGSAGFAVAVALGMGIAVSPAIGLAMSAIMLTVPLLLSPLARLAFVVAGAMVVLNVSDSLSVSKIGYLLGCGLVVAIAIHRLPSLRSSKAYEEVRWLLRVSFFFAVFVALEMVLAISAGADPSATLRESAAYLLFASVPLLALDARSSSQSHLIGPLFVAVALVGTLSYAVEWVTYRDLAQLPIDRIALAGALPAALFSYLSAGFVVGRRRTLWALAAGIVLALLLVTGNRGGVVVLLGPLAISLLGGTGRWKRAMRLAVVGILVTACASLAVSAIGQALEIDTSYLSRRYESLLHLSDLRFDPSVRVRLAQTDIAWDVFRSHMIFGAGPGYEFVWYDPLTGLPESSQYIDSPMQFSAKFGALGLMFWISFVVAYGSVLLRLNRPPSVFRAAAFGFAAIQLAWAFVGSPLSDKGTALSLLMLLALSLPTDRHLGGKWDPRSMHRASSEEPSGSAISAWRKEPPLLGEKGVERPETGQRTES